MMMMMVETVSVDETEAEESLEILEDDVSTEILVRTDQQNVSLLNHNRV